MTHPRMSPAHLAKQAARVFIVLSLIWIIPAIGQDYTWDTNGSTSGFGGAAGNWDGTNLFWNPDLTGGNGGTLTAAPTSSDDLLISANITAGGTINLSGNQTANSIEFANPSGKNVVLKILNGASLAVTGNITDTGAGRGTLSVLNGTEANAASVLTANSIQAHGIDLTGTGADQFLTTGYDIDLNTQLSIGGVNKNATFRQTGGTITVSNASYGVTLLQAFNIPTSGTARYIMDGGTLSANRIGVANGNGRNNTTAFYAGNGVFEWNDGIITNFSTNSTLNIQNGNAVEDYAGGADSTKDTQLNTSAPVTIELSETGTHTFNADGASGKIYVSPSAQIVDKSGEAGTLLKTGAGDLIFTGGGSHAVNSWTGNTTVTAGRILTDYSAIAGKAATGGTDTLSGAYSADSTLILNGGDYALVGRGSASASSATASNHNANGYTLDVTSTAGLVVGQTVTNANLHSGTYIRRIVDGNTIELNAQSILNASLNGETLNFGAADFANTQTINEVVLQQAGTATTVTVTPGSGTSTTELNFGDVSGTGGFTKAGDGTLRLTGTLTYTGNTNVSAGTLEFAPVSGSSTLTGAITGSGNIVKSGAGTTILTGTHTYTGTTSVNGGTLTFVNDAITSNRSYEPIAAGATLEFDHNTGVTRAIGDLDLSGDGTFRKSGAGFLSITSSGAVIAMGSGALIHVADGTWNFGASAAGNWASNLSDMQVDIGATFEGRSTSIVVDALNGAGTVGIGGKTGTVGLTIGKDSGSGIFTGVIKNTSGDGQAFSLEKVGTGTQTLSGNNTYSGTTTVSAGRLNIGGINTGTGDFTVAANANLGGEGSIAGNLIFGGNNTLFIEPGTSGAFTTSGSLAVTSGNVSVDFANLGGAGDIIALTYGSYANSANVATDFIATNAVLSPHGGGSTTAQISGNSVVFDLGYVDNTWTGNTDGVWEIGGSKSNWTGGTSDTVFYDGDAVTFGATGAGTVAITGGDVAPSAITFAAGSGAYNLDANTTETLSVGSGGLNFFGDAATDDVTINAELVGSGTITKGAASSGASDVGQTFITHDNSNFTGVTVLNQGDLYISNVNALGNDSTNTITFDNFSADATFLRITDGGTLNNDFVINDSGFNQSKFIQFTAAGAGNLTLAGDILNNETKGFVFHLFAGGDDTITVDGLISGTGGLRVQGVNGAVVLANDNNSFEDGVLIDNSGTVQVGTIGDIGVNSGAGANSKAGAGFTLGLGNGSGTLEYTGAAGETNRQVEIGSNNAGTGTGTIKNSGSGALIWDATTFNVARTNATVDRTFTFDTNTADISVTGAIVDNHATNAKIAINKLGSETLTLSGINTYTGNTTVGAGTLLVNGSTSASSEVTVGTGATLGGNGTIGGPITVNAGGIHTAGTLGNGTATDAATQNINSTLTYSSGATVTWDLISNSASNPGTDFDQFNLTGGGTLAFGGDLTFDIDFGSAVDFEQGFWNAQLNEWKVWDTGVVSAIPGGTVTITNSANPSFNNAFILMSGNRDGSDLNGIWLVQTSAVPEPSTYALMGIGLAAFGWAARRRRRHQTTLSTEKK